MIFGIGKFGVISLSISENGKHRRGLHQDVDETVRR